MLRRVANPPNRFAQAYHEWIDAPPPAELQVFEEQARSALSENDSPDIGFRFSVNPYRGCQHACAYCYARPTHEYLDFGAGTDFDTKIVVKLNLPELLAVQLASPRWKRAPIAFSGVTDCYQPLEVVYRLTQRCLAVCLEAANPIFLVTKSYLVVRDAELLARLSQRCGARVWLSIPFADDAVARRVETGAPPPSRRFEAIEKLTRAGVNVGVFVAPVIPGLNDHQIADVLRRAAAAGATKASYTAVRLPGAVREVFFARLRERVPERAGRVEQRLRDIRGGRISESRFGYRMRGTGPYWESIERLFETVARREGLLHDTAELEKPVDEGDGACGGDSSRPAVRQLPLFQ